MLYENIKLKSLFKSFNSILNLIEIKTLYIYGIVLQGNKTSEHIEIFHSWIASLINGKWFELGATFGLFEGVPASHIFLNYGESTYYSSNKENRGKKKFGDSYVIKIINVIKEKNTPIIDYVFIIICLIILFCFPAVGNNNNVYPVLGKNVRMFSNSKIIGNSHIGNNVLVGANCFIKDCDIPDNVMVFGQSPNLIIKENHKDKVMEMIDEAFE